METEEREKPNVNNLHQVLLSNQSLNFFNEHHYNCIERNMPEPVAVASAPTSRGNHARKSVNAFGKATGGMAKGTMKGVGKIGNVAAGGVRRTTKIATAMPGSAVKGVGNAAKFGVNTTKFVAKGTVTGTAKAAKVRKELKSII